ncbi:MAG: hypothetical protein KDC87_17940 [Planctomycetes bacterium]|nr:hypothetical protein [Planctomycetota bacterium]MCB9890001.1 hypothetical protein [Planctomycetota bacterium]
MSSAHPVPAVLTALNPNGLAVARTLGRHGVKVFALHPHPDDPETRTRYAEVWPCPNDALLDQLLTRGQQFAERPWLLPITDESVTVVAQNLDALRRHYVISMPDPQLVLRLLDKRGFDEMARELGLPVPGTWFVRDREQLEAAIATLVFPCLMKPQEKTAAYFAAGGMKAYVFDDAEQLRSTWTALSGAEPRVVIQQYVPGGDGEVYFCLQANDSAGEAVMSFCGRKIRQWRPHCGGTSACEPVVQPKLAELTAEFFRRTGVSGPGSMEFKRDPRDGAFYMIEPTVCRPDWQNAVADANGAPIVYAAYCAALGLPIPAVRRRLLQRRWVLFGSDRLSADYYRRRGELSRIAWLWSIRPPVRGAYFALDDPRPYLAMTRGLFGRALAKLARLLGLRKKTTA